MLKHFKFTNKLSKSEEVRSLLENAENLCKKLSHKGLAHLAMDHYAYSTDDAVNELGLENELVHQLVEDYVIQILKSEILFSNYISELQKVKSINGELDYTPLRELAHKNLGVARNLRIRDAEKLLVELMTKEDLPYLEVCLNALESCAIKLKPSCAYDTLKLMDIKNSLLK